MRKHFMMIMAISLLCVGLAGCEGGSSPISKYCISLEKAREKMYKEDITNRDLTREINTQFMGQQLTTETDGDVFFEIIEPFKVTDLSPLYGGIEFEALIKSTTPENTHPAKPQDYVFIACDDNKPIIILDCKSKWNEDESYNIRFFLNVGNIIQGGEGADEKMRGINRIVITEYGSDLFQKINN